MLKYCTVSQYAEKIIGSPLFKAESQRDKVLWNPAGTVNFGLAQENLLCLAPLRRLKVEPAASQTQ